MVCYLLRRGGRGDRVHREHCTGEWMLPVICVSESLTPVLQFFVVVDEIVPPSLDFGLGCMTCFRLVGC